LVSKSLSKLVESSDATRVGQKAQKKAEQKAKAKRLPKEKYGVSNGKPLKRLSNDHIGFVTRYIANGWNAYRAYLETYRCNELTAAKRGPLLANDPLILEEIQRQWKPMLEDAEADIGYLSKKIYNFTRANMADYFRQVTIEEPMLDNNGDPMYEDDGTPRLLDVKQRLIFKDLHDLPLWMQQNIKEIEIVPGEFGDHVKLKLVDSFKATMELAKHLGVFKGLDEDGDLNSLKTALVQGAMRAQQKAEQVRNGSIDGEFSEVKDVGSSESAH